jgi:flagellar biosynthetic protein FlhB
MSLNNSLAWIGNSIYDIAITIAMYMCIFAAADYFYQWWQYEKDIRMTKQEIKDEFKQTEGDPQVKSRIKEIQRKMATMRMMRKVPEADVVIRNPTHYAVALKYKPGKDRAPIVVAKGINLVALRIIEIAEQHGVELVENKPLARGLYEAVELDRAIPEEFYKPVAEILA